MNLKLPQGKYEKMQCHGILYLQTCALIDEDEISVGIENRKLFLWHL